MRYILILFLLLITSRVTAFIGYIHGFKATEMRLRADTDTAKAVHKQSVSAGVSYGNDASFFGRTNEKTYPFMTTDVIYNAKFGMFVYGSLWKVFGSIPTIDEGDLGLGYSYKLSKKFKGVFSYTRFIFSDQTQILKSSSSNDLELKNTYDWNILKSGVTFDYLFGKSSDVFVTISNSHYFESNFSVFDDKDYITFTPSFNVILGTQNFVQKYSQDHDFFIDMGMPPNSTTPQPQPPDESDYSKFNRTFNVLNYDFRLPIAYNRPHYTIEASYRYSIPVNVQGFLNTQRQSFFNLTFYYVFY